MITLIVPTRNRAHTLRRVGETFYRQRLVDEIIFVDDCGSDDSHEVIAALAQRFPHVRTRVLRHEERRGAAASRTDGYTNATNEFVLFCDDDVFLEPGYAETCLAKLQATGAAIVSGRLVHKRANQTPEAAIVAFGNGSSSAAPFKRLFCEFRVEARFDGDLTLPLTHSVILTRRSLLETYGYDPFYSRGNGYREESDFQMNAFVHGETILMTNATHCVELSRQENPSGGQRVSRLQRLFWNVYYTNYFYRKYWPAYAARIDLRVPRPVAIGAFAFYQVYVLFLRPAGRLVRETISARRPTPAAAAPQAPLLSRRR